MRVIVLVLLAAGIAVLVVATLFRRRARDVLDNRRTQWFLIAFVILTSALPGVAAVVGPSPFFPVATEVALGIFIAEMALRVGAHGWRLFRDPWFAFDALVLAIALVPGGSSILILRLLRLLRIMRLSSRFPVLDRLASGLAGAVPGLAVTGAFMAFIIYLTGAIATSLFGTIAPRYFDDLGTSLMTLFQAMTGEGWPDVARAVTDKSPIAWTFFVAYILVCTLGVLNVLIAVIVSGMEREDISEATERQLAFEETLLTEIRALRTEVAELRGSAPPPTTHTGD